MSTTGVPPTYDVAVEYFQAGRLQEAEAVCRQLLVSEPDNAFNLHLLGGITSMLGNNEEAVNLVAKAISKDDKVPEFYNDMGNLLKDRKDYPGAIAAYQKALTLAPDLASAHCNYGLVLQETGELDKAIEQYHQTLGLMPQFGLAHKNLAGAYFLQGNLTEAANECQEAMTLLPDDAEVKFNFGKIMSAGGRLREAAGYYQQALELRPGFPEALINLAMVMLDAGTTEEAARLLEKVIELQPDFAPAYSNLLLLMNYIPDADPGMVFQRHRSYADRYEAPLATGISPHENSCEQGRRLKIGYVSAGFYRHAQTSLIEPVISAHDRSRVEVYCYHSANSNDAVTERLRGVADHWRDIAGIADDEVASGFRKDGIDILVDLTGHGGMNRLPVFARKPAPVLVTWLGYPGTTGLKSMDYRLTDSVADPQGMTEQYYTEQLVRLPGCYCCYQPPVDAPDIAVPPASIRDSVTFGSFNSLAHLNVNVLNLWVQVLLAVPGSRLVLASAGLSEDTTRQSVFGIFTAAGVEPDRVDLREAERSDEGRLGLYRDIDIVLDPFPFSNNIATLEALWMGVPVVTLAGNGYAGRTSASLLHALDLDALVADSTANYVAAASRIASDTGHLLQLRHELRARMSGSALLDASAFVKNLENSLFAMWEDWCRKQA